MYTSVNDDLLKGKTTPLGVALDVSNNSRWLTLLMYATPHISVDLPVLNFTGNLPPVTADVKGLTNNIIELIESDTAAIEQMAERNLDDVYFLAQRPTDKLAIAAYTLYLYGKQ